MNITVNKKLLVDAISSCSFSSMQAADGYTKLGLATFTGNQWNEEWEWVKPGLEKLSFEELVDLYNEVSAKG